MDSLIFQENVVRIVNGKKSKGILSFNVDSLSFDDKSGKDTFSIIIPDLRKTELTSGVEKSLFSKKHYIDFLLENNEIRFIFPEERIDVLLEIYTAKKKEFEKLEYQKELEVRKTVFNAYIKKKIGSIDSNNSYSDALKARIDTDISEIEKIEYDDGMSMDANKYRVDSIIDRLNIFISSTLKRERIDKEKKSLMRREAQFFHIVKKYIPQNMVNCLKLFKLIS